MKKLLISLAITIITIPTTFNMVVAHADTYEQITQNIGSANEFYKQMNADDFTRIMESYNQFCDEHSEEFQTNIPKSDAIATYFACYYNESGDNKLDVYLTSYKYQGYFEKYFPEEFTNYHVVENSIFDLHNIESNITDEIEGEYASQIDVLNNSISISVETKEDYNEIKKLNEDDVNVKKENIDLDKQANIYGGKKFYVGGYYDTAGTITCSAYKASTNQYGFLTAYHVVSSKTAKDISISGYIINKTNKFIGNKSIDAAFVPNTNNSVKTTWQYANVKNTQKGYFNGATTPLAGTKVCVLGATTNERYAKVTSDSTSSELRYTYTSSITKDGDSGAPVVYFTKSGTNGRAWLTGIHKGIQKNTKYGFACNIKKACSKLGVVVCS